MYTPDRMAVTENLQRVGAIQVMDDDMVYRYPEEVRAATKSNLSHAVAREIADHLVIEEVRDQAKYLTEFRCTVYVVKDIGEHLAAIKREIDRAYEKGVADAEGWTPPASRNPDDLR